MVGNGHAMGVAGQVLEDVFRSAEWWLGVDHPILAEQQPQKAVKELGFAQTHGRREDDLRNHGRHVVAHVPRSVSVASDHLIVRHEEAKAALNHAGLSKDMHAALAGDGAVVAEGLPGPAFARHMLGVDPPDHTRLRRLTSAAFSRPRIAALRPRVQTIVDQLLDRDVAAILEFFERPNRATPKDANDKEQTS